MKTTSFEKKTWSERAARTGEPDRAAVEQLAYQLWLQRGCPADSPEEDWYQAEQALRNKAA